MPRRENYQVSALAGDIFGSDAFTTDLGRTVGIRPSALAAATRAGTLRREARGLYSRGGDPYARARHVVEELAARGAPAAIGGRSAAEIWGIPVFGAHGPLTEAPLTLVVARGARVRQGTRSGVRIRICDLDPADILHIDPRSGCPSDDGVPLTSPLRTGLDVVRDVGRSRASALIPLCGATRVHIQRRHSRGDAPAWEVTTAAERPDVRHETLTQLHRIASKVNSHGMRWFYAVLADVEPSLETALEGLAWSAFTESTIPRPRPQVWVKGRSGRAYRVDFLVGERVIVEADGADKYSDQTPWLEKQRQSDLEAAGYWVVRCTWEELLHRPHEVLARIRHALRQCA